ncbi:SIR2 family protein [uncultured Cohaesibacter sp.]|uniref:SIR2 family NAD-dependent protein deacylase n=1 Tax=uncultured Cohaesibacter sp. TaxID=1002546 RepID=UPI002AA95D4D|nr:SIR2 family protein [uncultured Cohaesibacter sp.]
MSEYFEIAYAAAAKRLCLFTGTGFSKALTEGKVPGWQELLENVCEKHAENSALKDILFPADTAKPLHLEEAAQVVELDLLGKNKNLHEIIAKIVAGFPASGEIEHVKSFLSGRSFRIVTTNYDKIAEELIGTDCLSLSPGLPVPKSNSRAKVYHIHGSVEAPSRMVVTASDYFEFMHSESYFSRKLSTILHESTVVILGYSLGDANLKSILNEYSGFMKTNTLGSNIFFVSRSRVDQPIIDYYANCYGIRVIDDTTIETFFQKLEKHYPEAERVLLRSLRSIERVLKGGRTFKDSFLKMEDSFYEVVSALSAKGYSLEDTKAVKMFDKIVTKKQELCSESGAWEQYEHLASWLIILGSLLDIKGRSLEGTYLEAVKYSMEHMSQEKRLGYSWQAFKIWSSRWGTIRASNRTMIKDFILEKSIDRDAKNIVSVC